MQRCHIVIHRLTHRLSVLPKTVPLRDHVGFWGEKGLQSQQATTVGILCSKVLYNLCPVPRQWISSALFSPRKILDLWLLASSCQIAFSKPRTVLPGTPGMQRAVLNWVKPFLFLYPSRHLLRTRYFPANIFISVLVSTYLLSSSRIYLIPSALIGHLEALQFNWT